LNEALRQQLVTAAAEGGLSDKVFARCLELHGLLEAQGINIDRLKLLDAY